MIVKNVNTRNVIINFTKSSDMSNFAVTIQREHWSKKSEKLSPSLSVVCTQH